MCAWCLIIRWRRFQRDNRSPELTTMDAAGVRVSVLDSGHGVDGQIPSAPSPSAVMQQSAKHHLRKC